MNTLVVELGKRLADRWLSALVLPGLLFVAAVYCGTTLGHSAALDAGLLTAGLARSSARIGSDPATAVLTVAGALLTATTSGLAVQGLAVGVRRAWVARRPRRLVARRRSRAAAERDRIGHRYPERYLPARTTAIGDRFRLVDERVDAQYGLSVALAWPRLWLLLPETMRPVIDNAHARYRSSAETTAWGLLTVLLGLLWWPAALVGLCTVVVGHRKGLASSSALADLVEAVVDTHQQQLAEALGVDLPHGRVTPREGLQINDILNKRA